LQPLTVYLDTSDYSRFGDVVRGCSDADTGRLYHTLLEYRCNGSVNFVYSLPILSELLQYDSRYPTTTESKALAVEALCGQNAFFWPIRAIAFDVSVYLTEQPAIIHRPISFDSEWHPALSDEIGDLKKTLEEQLASELASRTFLNRGQRRAAEAKIRKFRLTEVGPTIIQEVAEKYAIEPAVVARAVIPALEGKLSSAEGARRLAAAIAKPTAFVENYFDPEKNQARELPTLISPFELKYRTRSSVFGRPLKTTRPKRSGKWLLV
jgi:hypothetical protein